MATNTIFTINFTDPTNGAITLNPGTFNGPVPGQPITGNELTDLRLHGLGTVGWGEGVNENFIHLLENFASPQSDTYPETPRAQNEAGPGFGINHPIKGQLWYNTTNDKLYVYIGTGWERLTTDLVDITTGHVPFVNANTLAESVIFTTNDNIGISMIPSYKLDVNGTIRSLGNLFVEGGVGIGTLSIGSNKLAVNGDVSISGNLTSDVLTVNTLNVTNIDASSLTFDNLTNGYLPYASSNLLTNSVVYTNGTNVGIGTNVPASKLDVNGNVTIGVNGAAGGEGGEIILRGTTAYPTEYHIDRYADPTMDLCRVFGSSSNDMTMWLKNFGTGKFNLNVEGTILTNTFQEVCAANESSISGSVNITATNTTLLKYKFVGNTTFSNLTNPGESITLVLLDGDSFTITWPSDVYWIGGSAPVLTGRDVVILTNINNVNSIGTVLGMYLGDF